MLLFSENYLESTGILREVWFKGINSQDDPILKYHPVFKEAADTLSVLKTFHVVTNFSTTYGQRLSTFIQVQYTCINPSKVPLSAPKSNIVLTHMTFTLPSA